MATIEDIYGNPIPVASQYQAFVSKLLPVASQVSLQTGINPEVLLAQYQAEYNPNLAKINNYGGIKYAGAATPDAYQSTQTSPSGAAYAGYKSLQDFAAGDAAFYLDNSAYADLLQAASEGASPSQQIADLANSGYSSNSNYGELLTSVYDAMFPGNGNALSVPLQSPSLIGYGSSEGTPLTSPVSSGNNNASSNALPEGFFPSLNNLLNSDNLFGIEQWIVRGLIAITGIAIVIMGISVIAGKGTTIINIPKMPETGSDSDG